MASLGEKRSIRAFFFQSQLKTNSASNLNDANDAGWKYAIECPLILSARDSANVLAESGLSRVGHDRYGVFPVCGKKVNIIYVSYTEYI